DKILIEAKVKDPDNSITASNNVVMKNLASLASQNILRLSADSWRSVISIMGSYQVSPSMYTSIMQALLLSKEEFVRKEYIKSLQEQLALFNNLERGNFFLMLFNVLQFFGFISEDGSQLLATVEAMKTVSERLA